MARSRLFMIPELPKGDYVALQWARQKLDALQEAAPHASADDAPPPPTGQRDVVILGIRLVALMLQGGLDLETVLRVGQEASVLKLLKDFQSIPPSQGEGAVLVPR